MEQNDQQRTEQWFADRLGKVTASNVKNVMAKIKTGEAAARREYRAKLVAERLTGQRAEQFTNNAMQWGIDNEAGAKQAYQTVTFKDVVDCWFVQHGAIANAGASPDGLVDDDGLVEIKCPQTGTHLETLATGKIDRDYILQMQFQLACTGRKWCDFVSYDPRLPSNAQIFIKRVHRDNELIAEMEMEIIDFLKGVDEQEATVKNYVPKVTEE